MTKIKNQKVKFKNVSGVTLVELLIYVGLLSIFLTILTTLFVSIFRLQLTTQSTSSLTQDTRFILSRLSYDLGQADTVTTPGTLGQTSSSLVFTKSGVSYSYSVDVGGNFILEGNGSSDKLNSLDTKMAGISFKRLGFIGGKPMIQIIFTIDSDIAEGSGLRSQTIQTTYGIR